MTIDWNAFTPMSALAGGVLIGLAAAMLVLLNGRVAGISGIVAEALPRPRGDTAWRLAFIAGLLLAPALVSLVAAPPALRIETGTAGLVAAGLLVGVGARLGSGCTSGHGVCGISQGSMRSVAATLTFMAVAFATVFVLRHGAA